MRGGLGKYMFTTSSSQTFPLFLPSLPPSFSGKSSTFMDLYTGGMMRGQQRRSSSSSSSSSISSRRPKKLPLLVMMKRAAAAAAAAAAAVVVVVVVAVASPSFLPSLAMGTRACCG